MTKTPDLLEDYRSALNLTDLWLKLHNYLANFGITSIFYGFGHSSQLIKEEGMADAAWFRSSHPEEYRNYFDAKFHINDDLTAMHCMHNTSPFIWHEVKHWEKSTERQRKFMLDSYGFYMGVGVTLPIRFNQFGVGGIGLSAAGMNEKDFDDMWESKRDEIITMSYMFDEFSREEHMEDIIPLKKVEKEALTLLASGLTPKQIAYKLNKGYTTKKQQLESARVKLKARNNEQAVVKALILGLITP